jgi:chloride channel protein, CIC family
MVESGFTRLPVVDGSEKKRLRGMVSLDDLLRARGRNLEEERTRERILRLRVPLGRRTQAENLRT